MRTETFFGEPVGDASFIARSEAARVSTRVVTNHTVGDAVTAFYDGVAELVQELAELLPVRSITGVRITDLFAAALGIAPGAPLSLMTACGLVAVDVGTAPDVEALRRALKGALDEIVEHNREYKYTTPKDMLAAWRQLV